MNKTKRQQIDEHNYNYWLKENTSKQRRAIAIRSPRSKRLTTKSQVALALMASCGVGSL